MTSAFETAFVKVKVGIAEFHLRAMGHHLFYGITHCHLVHLVLFRIRYMNWANFRNGSAMMTALQTKA